MEQPKCTSRDDLINKMWLIYNRILFSLKKEGKSDICYGMAWMKIEDIMLNEMRITKRQILFDSTHMRYLG